MKKLLVLLSSSIFFSLTTLSIYVLNSKNNVNQVPSFVLKQKEQNEETDLSKIFDWAYVSIKDRTIDTKAKVINAIKLKYSSVDVSQLEIEIKTYPSDGGVDVIITPKKPSSKYINSAKIPCYSKEDIKNKLKQLKLNTPINVEINDVNSIFNALKDKGLSNQFEVDFKIKEIKENSAIFSSTEVGDFYGEVEIKFNSNRLTLNSIIRDSKLQVEKLKNDEITKTLITKYPKLKEAKLSTLVNEQNKTITVITNNKAKFDGTISLSYELITKEPMHIPNQSEPIIGISSKPKIKNEQLESITVPKTPVLKEKTNEFSKLKMLPDKPNDSPNKSSISKIKSNEGKTISSKPHMSDKSLNEAELESQSKPLINSPHSKNLAKTPKESKIDKDVNSNTSVIDKSKSSSTTNSKILQIPNKKLSNSNKDSKSSGSKTGVIVGSTLGVSSIVGIGATGSWFYFKKRK
ncbi:hypothetical protein V2P53_01940 [Mycoplasma capricolum subsp. capricolum]|uniref:hypothetical protein n=1 Tax=Mycoplasma capricolum TaxID=2095 RepID=UPI003DA3F027